MSHEIELKKTVRSNQKASENLDLGFKELASSTSPIDRKSVV